MTWRPYLPEPQPAFKWDPNDPEPVPLAVLRYTRDLCARFRTPHPAGITARRVTLPKTPSAAVVGLATLGLGLAFELVRFTAAGQVSQPQVGGATRARLVPPRASGCDSGRAL